MRDGVPLEVSEPGVEGELALRAGLAIHVPRLPAREERYRRLLRR